SLAMLLGETAQWERIQNSKNVSDYQSYLKDYPKGRYAEIATRRIQPPDPGPVKTDPTPLKSQKGVLVILTNTAASVVVKPRDAALRPVQGQSVDNKFRAELPPGVYDIEVSAAKYSPKKVAGIE